MPLPHGGQLVTLGDAARHIQKLPAADQRLEAWQTAIEILLLVVEMNGPTMLARIAVIRALNRGRPAPVSEPRRKRAKAYKLVR